MPRTKALGTRRYIVKHLPTIQRNGEICYRVKLDCGHVRSRLKRPIVGPKAACTQCEEVHA